MIRKINFLFFVAILFFGLSCNSTAQKKVEEGNEIYVSEKPVIVDVRTLEEFVTGSIEGAINIPLSELENRLQTLKSYDEIIVYCQAGGRSAKAASILIQNNFSNVIDGGGIADLKARLENE